MRWPDRVKMPCKARALELRYAKVKSMVKVQWRDLVIGSNEGLSVKLMNKETFDAKQ